MPLKQRLPNLVLRKKVFNSAEVRLHELSKVKGDVDMFTLQANLVTETQVSQDCSFRFLDRAVTVRGIKATRAHESD